MNTEPTVKFRGEVFPELKCQLIVVLCSLASTVIQLSAATLLFDNWLISMETTAVESQAIRPTISHQRKDSEIGGHTAVAAYDNSGQLISITIN